MKLSITKILIFTIFAGCSERNASNFYRSCDLNFRFELDQNTSIQFYDSTGSELWTWKNDSVDFIYTYFHVNSSINNLVRIDSIMILNGGNNSRSHFWELDLADGIETVDRLIGSWIKLNDCKTELSEWMLYEDSFTPNIFEKPDSSSIKTGFDPREGWENHEVKILEVKGNWIFAELTLGHETITGWFPSFHFCANPHTSCN
ncbi:MAG: hypothetical protein JJU02_01395 [Cryomorphaceae bacterium]|nr:hypothetical protein [Cryomorphaceae bacterium]